METLLQDLRYGLRMLARNPGFAAVAILTLAFGIGANTAIFSVVNAVLFRRLPYRDADRLVQVWPVNLKQGTEGGVPFPNFFDWRDRNVSFKGMAAYSPKTLVIRVGQEPEQIMDAAVTPNLFPLLGVKAILGRTLLPEDDRPEVSPVVLVGHNLWQRRFGSDPGFVGKMLYLDGKGFTVVGIMPPGFRFPEDFGEPQIWAPASILYSDIMTSRSTGLLKVVARVRSDVKFSQAQAEMESISLQLEQQYPESNTGWTVRLIPLHEEMVQKSRVALLLLLGCVVFVLLIACVNVANLLLARASTRQKEIAIRTALGASRPRLVRQYLTESILLGLLGGTAGLLMASWSMNLLLAAIPETVPRAKEIAIDWQVCRFTLGISILTGILFGLTPALRGSKLNLNESLKAGGRTGAAGADPTRIQNLLVVSELALSLVLLIAAGLLMKSFWRLHQIQPGFNPENVMVVSLTLPDYKYAKQEQQLLFYDRTLERIKSLPGVRSVGISTVVPLGGSRSRQGIPVKGLSQEIFVADDRAISPDYFQVLSIPLIKGRTFTERDRVGTSPVLIVNETMARSLWPGQEPIGKRIEFGSGFHEVVGVVGNVKHLGLSEESGPEMYMPYAQQPAPWINFVIRGTGDWTKLAAVVRKQIWAIDGDQPISRITSLEHLLYRSLSAPRFSTLLLTIFAFVACALAAVGIYGAISHFVARRAHEIGIRMALGAQPTDVLRLVVGQGSRLVLAGIVIGLSAAFVLTRILSSLLFGVTATDPLTFTVVSLLVTAVALLNCYIPARSATRIDPITALRNE
jgi:putative ABC transport system permease protein